jgi:hypothetical protein
MHFLISLVFCKISCRSEVAILWDCKGREESDVGKLHLDWHFRTQVPRAFYGRGEYVASSPWGQWGFTFVCHCLLPPGNRHSLPLGLLIINTTGTILFLYCAGPIVCRIPITTCQSWVPKLSVLEHPLETRDNSLLLATLVSLLI